MICAVVDDLLFSSKIRETARQIGVGVTFVRAPGDVAARVRELAPSLVIVDLNNHKTDPIAAVEAIKADAELSDVRTLAFVAHVRVDLVDRARAAGVDDVLARSAFAGNLPGILATARPA